MHGIIPLKAILLKRHIGTDDLCPVCKSEPEDVMHMVFKCPEIMQIWNILGIQNWINNGMTSGHSGPQVFETLLKSPTIQVPGLQFHNCSGGVGNCCLVYLVDTLT
jgi:hypothetical protein